MSAVISQDDAYNALQKVKQYAADRMNEVKSNTDAYFWARQDRDWADRTLRGAR